jgi:hypothetical protein
MRREPTATDFAIPPLLEELLSSGRWPNDPRIGISQNLRPLAPPERVRRFAPEEEFIYLNSPPFRTIADEMRLASLVVVDEFWKRLAALDQIVPEKALILGDFGMGSDAPIILDYARDASDPPVLRLRYAAGGDTAWVRGARNFEEFATMLGLAGGVA